MAISQYPGVGPTNTDVASAVVTAGTAAGFAATGPTTTQIAAAVPTLAQITTAITSNAASAGVTMAAITSSITANAASAGLTVAAITAAGNSAGWGTTGGETWTALTSGTFNNTTNTIAFSSLSGYKKYRIVLTGVIIDNSANDNMLLRMNSVSSADYHGSVGGIDQTQETAITAGNYSTSLSINPQQGNRINTLIEVEQANLTGYKTFTWQVGTLASNSGVPRFYQGFGGLRSTTAAISSIQIFTQAGNNFQQGAYTIYGGN